MHLLVLTQCKITSPYEEPRSSGNHTASQPDKCQTKEIVYLQVPIIFQVPSIQANSLFLSGGDEKVRGDFKKLKDICSAKIEFAKILKSVLGRIKKKKDGSTYLEAEIV